MDTLNEIIVNEQAHIAEVFFILFLSAVLGYVISLIYKRTHVGYSYNESFNFTLVMTTIIVSLVMYVIGSNIAMSLGLIGALSIIRFRTVLKDTNDMAYLFWTISVGIAVGASFFAVALLATIFIGVVVVILRRIRFTKDIKNNNMLIVKYSNNFDIDKIKNIFNKKNIDYEVRNINIDKDMKNNEIVYYLIYKNINNFEKIVNDVSKLSGVNSVKLLHSETNLFI